MKRKEAERRRRVVESAVRSRFLQYAAVGAVATVAHYAILVSLVEGGWLAPQRAAAFGAWVGAQVAFAGNAAFTFRGSGATFGTWMRFQLTALLGAVLSFGLVAAGVHLGVHYLLAQVAATLVALAVTFEINRHWSFVSPRPSRS
jgi:putative flippase GtrA